MDPNACLARFLTALEDDEAHEAWGFEPADKEGLAKFRSWVRLDRFTSIGSYPLVYLRGGHTALCAACASLEGIKPHECDIHWEGDPVDCEECGEGIASAYGSAEVVDERSPEDVYEGVE